MQNSNNTFWNNFHGLKSLSLTTATSYSCAMVAAFCGVAYELLLASYATYLLGASIFRYSIVISLMMASMGVGALLTNRSHHRALKTLLIIETALACVAAVAIPILYFAFAKDLAPQFILYTFVILIGGALGMEIPLLNQLQKSEKGLSRILFFDYLGGFMGGIIFPIWLVPQLGFFRIAALLSFFNAWTGFMLATAYFKRIEKNYTFWIYLTLFALTISFLALYFAEPIRIWMELKLFGIKN